MSHFRFTPLAARDLEEIVTYLAARNPAAAARLLDDVTERLKGLAAMPLSGRKREELSSSLRSVPVGGYVIFYQPVEEGVIVVRILHGARDIARLLQEE